MKGANHDPRGEFRRPTFLGGAGKIIAMGILLAMLVFAFLFTGDKPKKTGQPVINRPPVVDLAPFELDREILAQIKDTSKSERTYIEHAPWMHLMRKSYNIGPAAAEALRASDFDTDVAALRREPERYRGDFVSLKGKLVEFREEKRMHPVARALAYKGQLTTANGESVLFFVSKPLDDRVLEKKDAWVRIEGFFMKVRDEYPFNPPDVLGAPLIIGPRVELAYPDWKAVDKLDLNVVKRVKNARWANGRWVDTDDMRTMLADSQDVPLWHMTSYALHELERMKAGKLRHTNVFELKGQYDKFKSGEYQQGQGFRLRGQFIGANVFRARTNPVGIDFWSEVWIQIPRMGAKMIPIWIPIDIGDWEKGEGIDIDCFYFKNYGYEPYQGGDKHTPLFVGGSLERFKMESHPANLWIGLGFAGFLGLVAFIFFRMNRQAKRESNDYKSRLVERRRTRRTTAAPFQRQ